MAPGSGAEARTARSALGGHIRVGIALIAILGLLGGCSVGTQAVIDEALGRSEAGIKAAKDREAIALKQAPCLIGLGAANRVLTRPEFDAAQVLCGGSPGLTFQDLTDLTRAMATLRALDGRMVEMPAPLADGLPGQ